MVEASLGYLSEPFFYFVEPAKRLYWMHLLGSVLLAGLYFWFKKADTATSSNCRQVLSLKYWWNESTRVDYVLLFFNSALKLALFTPLFGGQLVVAIFTARHLHLHVAEAPHWVAAPLLVSAVFTLIAFVFDDLTRFLTHLVMHRIPLLWRIHRLHHTATTLTPFTVFRTHPVEALINFARSIVALGVVSGVFIWALGPQLQVWDILGVNALGFVLTFAGSNLRHSHIPLHFGPLERVLISPAQHQLHHSKHHGHCNLGSYLSCWDRLAATLVAGTQAINLEFGLNEPTENPDGALPLWRKVTQTA